MKQPDWNIIIDYLTGEISGEDRRAFEKWLNENSENREYFESIKKFWDTEPDNLPDPDTEASLAKVLDRIQNARSESRVYKLQHTPKSKPEFIFVLASRFFKAAAVVFFVLGAFYFYRIVTGEADNVNVTKTFTRIDTLTLSDGSRVIADAGTELQYSERLPRLGIREIRLSGEAYFDVTHNRKAPFKVTTKNGTVTVLGTRFNVSDWNKENKITVAVASGKVSLQSTGEDNESVILNAGQMSSVTDGGAPLPPQEVDVNSITSWINREMYFRNTSLKEVFNLIERWYNVKIEIDDSALLNSKMTIFIQNKPVEENLKLICSIFDLHYSIDGNRINLLSNRD